MIWDKENIQSLLDNNPKAVMRAVVAIYKLQTESEQASDRTTEANGVGFGAFDAEFCSDIARKVQRGWTLSPKQLAVTRNKVKRYWRQLAEIANNKVAVVPTIQSAVPDEDPEEAENRMVMQEVMAGESRKAIDEEMTRIRAKYAYRMGVEPGQFA